MFGGKKLIVMGPTTNKSQQKTYRVPYIVLYDGTSHSRTVEVPALTSQEARNLAEVKINNLEPEADSFEFHGYPEVIV